MDQKQSQLESTKRRAWRKKHARYSGMVFCPLRLSRMAVMRCGEYQVRDRCGVGCRSAATPEELTRLNKIREPVKSRELGTYTVRELAKRENVSIGALQQAIRYGLLRADLATIEIETATKGAKRRRVRLITEEAWSDYKNRGMLRKPGTYTVSELAKKENISSISILKAINCGALFAEVARLRIQYGARVRCVYVIAEEDWQNYKNSKKKNYTLEFKREAVGLIERSENPAKQARELGLRLSQFRKWREQL